MCKIKFLKIAENLLVFTIMVTLSSCGCNHKWQNATCTEPKTCSLCGATEGESLGHDFEDATCMTPKTCSVCAETEGKALGHDFVDGFCTRCRVEDPDYFDPDKYGFTKDYGMNNWIEITKYSIGTENASAIYENSEQLFFEFKDNVFSDYRMYGTNSNKTLNKTSTYKILNNDSVNIYDYSEISANGRDLTSRDSIITIKEREYDSNGNLILITIQNAGHERWFILEDQIDWEKSPVETVLENGRKAYTYYFK